jgi:hypothetical protein
MDGTGLGTRDPRYLSVRSALVQRAVLRDSARALATGETAAHLFELAALLDALAAEEKAAWRAVGAALAWASANT